MTPIDFINEIFIPISQLGDFNVEFFFGIILEYHKQLIINNIKIPEEYINYIITSVLLKHNQFAFFQNMIQFHALAESENLASILRELTIKNNQKAFQLYMDIMFRMGKYQEIVYFLIEKMMVFSKKIREALEFAKSHQVKNLDYQILLKSIRSIESEKSRKHLESILNSKDVI